MFSYVNLDFNKNMFMNKTCYTHYTVNFAMNFLQCCYIRYVVWFLVFYALNYKLFKQGINFVYCFKYGYFKFLISQA